MPGSSSSDPGQGPLPFESSLEGTASESLDDAHASAAMGDEGPQQKAAVRNILVDDVLVVAPQSKRTLIGTYGRVSLFAELDRSHLVTSGEALVLEYLGPGSMNHVPSGVSAEFSRLVEKGPFTPDQPLSLEIPDTRDVTLKPGRLIIATILDDHQKPSLTSLRIAAESSLRLADSLSCTRVLVQLGRRSLPGIPADQNWRALLSGIIAALPGNALQEVVILVPDLSIGELLRNLSNAKAQSFNNDQPTGMDLLDIQSEVYALADSLLLRDLEPPLTVGVLGGWGSGKSFVLHLLLQRMIQIRSQNLTPDQAWGTPDHQSPYVGHPYVISFDAWTYAKADLWASLMQSIFRELSRAVSLEKKLQEAGIHPLTQANAWRALHSATSAERESMLLDPNLKAVVGELLDSSGREELGDDALWKQLQAHRKSDLAALEETNRQLAGFQAKLAEKRRKLAEKVESDLAREARRNVWRPFVNRLKSMLREKAEAQVQSVPKGESKEVDPSTVDEILKDVSVWKALRHRPPIELVGLAAFAIVVSVVPLIIGKLEPVAASWKISGLIGGAVSVLAGFLRTFDRWTRWIAEQREEYDKILSEENGRLEKTREHRLEEALAAEKQKFEEQLKKGETDDDNLVSLEAKVRKLEAQAETQKARIGPTARFVSLSDFIQSRVEKNIYEEKLGLMQQVQRDFVELTEALLVGGKRSVDDPRKKEEFPRGPARVLLFVEDLDRCPPEKVVEVLEATQLLVKTGLFVVVLAMDVRYVTRSLEKRYEGILSRKGDPSGLHYIEKIVQLPYRVRPISPEALPKYIQAQIQVELNAKEKASQAGSGVGPGGRSGTTDPKSPNRSSSPPPLLPSLVKFTEEEFNIISAACAAAGSNPRAVKRVINVCKLLKIIWTRPGTHLQPSQDVKKLVVLLVAMSSRLPNIMREVLEEMSGSFERNSPEKILEALAAYKPDADENLEGPEWERIAGLLKNGSLIPAGLTFAQVGAPAFNLVRSFSFVGDIGGEVQQLENGKTPDLSTRKPEKGK